MSSNLSLIEASLTSWNFSSRPLTSSSTIRLKPENDDCTINVGNNDNKNDNDNNDNNNNDNNTNSYNVNSDADDDNDDHHVDIRQRLS